MINRVFVAVLLFLVAGCGETSTARYATREEAAKDGAILRGWLPEWLPASASEIYETHDLDTNKSSAFFRYAPGDEPKLPSACQAVSVSRLNATTNSWVAPKGSQPFAYYECPETIHPGETSILHVAIDRGTREVYLER